MAHSHSHGHGKGESYFVEQLFSIGLCGALGGIAVLMYLRQVSAKPGKPAMLGIILAPPFHPYVLAGGIALLVLVAIRVIAVWQAAGKKEVACTEEKCEHEQPHSHGAAKPEPLGLPLVQQEPAHSHSHTHSHSHGHSHANGGHDHGWAPWRYEVLMLPVVLFLLDLPNSIFSARFQAVAVEEITPEETTRLLGVLGSGGGNAPLLGAVQFLWPRYTDGPVRWTGVGDQETPIVDFPEVRFSELERWAFNPYDRKQMTGKSVEIVGQFLADENNTTFNLTRYQMNCCAADAIPLKAVIMLSPAWRGAPLDFKNRRKQWVRVIGRVYFLKSRGKDEYVPALLIIPDDKHPPDALVQPVQPPANLYAN